MKTFRQILEADEMVPYEKPDPGKFEKGEHNVGIAGIREVQQRYPALIKKYLEICAENQHKPASRIPIVAATFYRLESSYSDYSRNTHILYKDDETRVLEGTFGSVSPYMPGLHSKENIIADSNKEVPLKSGEAVLRMVGTSYVTLYIYEGDAAILVEAPIDLDDLQKLALVCISGYIPAARVDQFKQKLYNPFSKDDTKALPLRDMTKTYGVEPRLNDYGSVNSDDIKELWSKILFSLQRKQLVQANGALSRTGKDLLFRHRREFEKELREKYGIIGVFTY